MENHRGFHANDKKGKGAYAVKFLIFKRQVSGFGEIRGVGGAIFIQRYEFLSAQAGDDWRDHCESGFHL